MGTPQLEGVVWLVCKLGGMEWNGLDDGEGGERSGWMVRGGEIHTILRSRACSVGGGG